MASVDVSTLDHAEALRAHVLSVVIRVTKPLIAQGPLGIIKVIFRDLKWESTQRHNKVAFQLGLPQKTIEAIKNLKREVEHLDWKGKFTKAVSGTPFINPCNDFTFKDCAVMIQGKNPLSRWDYKPKEWVLGVTRIVRGNTPPFFPTSKQFRGRNFFKGGRV